MPILLNVHKLEKSFAHRPLFKGISFGIESGDRVGLIGPNGAGKSTLLKIVAGKADADGGTVAPQRGLRIGYLEQVPAFQTGATVESTVLESVRDQYDWQELARAQEIMSRLQLEPGLKVGELSGGWRKRVALARELTRQPDLLLLDEPTNHLDIESILWLEEFLASAPFAVVTVTHDRLFLQRVSNRILELDRRNPDGLLNIRGDYTDYLYAKEQLMAAQESQEQKLRNTLRRETEWLRRGAQARQTKQQARIQQADELKKSVEDLAERNRKPELDIAFSEADKKPKRLIEAEQISKSYNGKLVFPKIDILITPKSRIGLLGVNGSGKSTLIRLLLKKEEADSGSVYHSEHLQVAYFEQSRESLDPDVSVLRSVCPEGEIVEAGGTRVHVRGYLSRFLFSPEQMDMPTRKLSGGEQSRLCLARLMTTPANVLVLDEPTNDLDMATLHVLEEMLNDFPGAVLLVTHDRYFMDQVANQILSFEDVKGEKKVIRFASLSQWEEWRAKKALTEPAVVKSSPPKSAATLKSKDGKKEFERLSRKIEKSEQALAELSEQSLDPKIATDAKRLAEIADEMTRIQAEIDGLYSQLAGTMDD